jgi:GT2 family glycosyltransferase
MTNPRTAIALINFNTASQTLRCLSSLKACSEKFIVVGVLDNASFQEDYARLADAVSSWLPGKLRILRSEINLGFAAGSNLLVDELLGDPLVEYVLLLNNDAVALPGLVNVLMSAMVTSPNAGMVGGRMHRLAEPERPDSLGIMLYANLMAANRLSLDEPFLGPTAGCCLMSRSFIEDVKQCTGHLFDPDFFCYWEDTDLVLRAYLLGYSPVYVDTLVALHEGQASTGGESRDFIDYHGLRNAIWTFVKCVPANLMLRYGALFLLENLMSIARCLVSGKGRMVWRVYRDAFVGLGRCIRQRRKIMAARRCEAGNLRRKIAPGVFKRVNIGRALRGMLLGR